MKHFFLPIFLVLLSKHINSQAYVYANNLSSSLTGQSAVGAVDLSGNSFVSGYFQGTAEFDPGPGTATVTAYLVSWDCYLTKYDAVWNYLWSLRMVDSKNS